MWPTPGTNRSENLGRRRRDDARRAFWHLPDPFFHPGRRGGGPFRQYPRGRSTGIRDLEDLPGWDNFPSGPAFICRSLRNWKTAPVPRHGFFAPSGVAVDSADNIYVAEAGNNLIRELTPGGLVIYAGQTRTSSAPPMRPAAPPASTTSRHRGGQRRQSLRRRSGQQRHPKGTHVAASGHQPPPPPPPPSASRSPIPSPPPAPPPLSAPPIFRRD